MFYFTSINTFWKSKEGTLKKIKAVFYFLYYRKWINSLYTNLINDDISYVLSLNPSLLYKIRLSCFSSIAISKEYTAKRLLGHYHILSTLYNHRKIEALFREGVLIFAKSLNGVDLKLVLTNKHGRGYEGELTLTLLVNENIIQKVHFHFYHNSIWIGGIQGGKNQLDMNKVVTKVTQGIRPQNFTYLALCSLAKSYHMDAIYGVTSANHIYQYSNRTRQRVKFNYDGFWQELSGQPTKGGVWYQLPLVYPRKSLDEIPSKKRSQYRRRYDLMNILEESIANDNKANEYFSNSEEAQLSRCEY